MRKQTYEELVKRRLTIQEALVAPRFPIILILQDVRSMYNVGSIFRSADAFRIEKLLLTGFTPTPPRKEISKTALDAEQTVPWEYYNSALDAINALKHMGWRVYAVEVAHGSRAMHALTVADTPSAFVLGNELVGLTNDVIDACYGSFEIPMFGVKHSLNVAVAAGITMYQAITSLTSEER